MLTIWSIVEKQIVEIFSKTKENKNSKIKGKQHMMELNKTVPLISKTADEYKRLKVEREKIMKEIQKEIKNMSTTIQS